MRPGQKTLLTIALAWLAFASSFSLAQDPELMRPQMGIGQLPFVIAANKRVTVDENATLPVYLVYQNNRLQAEQLRPELEQKKAIRMRKLEVIVLSLEQMLAETPDKASAIFIAEPLGDELQRLIEFSHQQKVLVFSPFKGDVERGVAAGFRVTDKVLPMVNMASLKKSNIHLKAFFLRIAVKHE